MAYLTVIIDEKNMTQGVCHWGNRSCGVNIGRSGVRPEAEKTEGDGATPSGTYKLKNVFYRADNLDRPETALPIFEITKDMGWCDDLKDPAYNTLIKKPFEASHEDMFRDDHLYNIVVETSHNDAPPVPGRGSAIFLHLKRDESAPTAGCIAFEEQDLIDILRHAPAEAEVTICLKS